MSEWESIGFEQGQDAKVEMIWECKRCGYIGIGRLKPPKICPFCGSELKVRNK